MPYREPGTEPGSSGLNFLGGPRSNWFNRDVMAFYKKLLNFYQDNWLNYDVLNVFLDVHLYLCHKEIFYQTFWTMFSNSKIIMGFVIIEINLVF